MTDFGGTRRPRWRMRYGALALVAGVIALGFAASSASAQTPLGQVSNPNELHFPNRTKPPVSPPVPANSPMLVQADEIKYDYSNDTVAAVGRVQIYYGGATIEADKVVYDQKTKRLRAEGNARLTEASGRDHLRPSHQSDRRLSRRIRQLAASRSARRHAVMPRSAPIARKAITRCCKTASTPLASRAKTTRPSRPSGRSRRRASFTPTARR